MRPNTPTPIHPVLFSAVYNAKSFSVGIMKLFGFSEISMEHGLLDICIGCCLHTHTLQSAEEYLHFTLKSSL